MAYLISRVFRVDPWEVMEKPRTAVENGFANRESSATGEESFADDLGFFQFDNRESDDLFNDISSCPIGLGGASLQITSWKDQALKGCQLHSPWESN